MKGELADLRADSEAAFLALEATSGLMYLDEFTNLLAADVDGLATSVATSASLAAFTTAALTGVQGTTEMVPPRNITVSTTAHANVDAVAITFVGRVRDASGALIAQTDTVTLTDGGGVTDAGIKAFSFVDSWTVPAQGGTGGAYTIGFGTIVGLTRKIKSAAGYLMRVLQVTAGSAVTNGTFASTVPNGTWVPNTAANGTNDYAVLYVTDNS